MSAYTCHWAFLGGVYTRGPAGFPFWWAPMPRRKPNYYTRGWMNSGWSLIESIDGLEFV